jgi:hypothetical protein
MAELEKTKTTDTKLSVTERRAFDTAVDNTVANTDIEKTSMQDDTAAKDPNIVDFDGPDDPENPLNWSATKKTTAMIFLMSMTALS